MVLILFFCLERDARGVSRKFNLIAATIQNGVVLYSAAFRPGSGAEWVVSAQPWSSFAPTVDSYFKQGLYATGIAACRLAV